MADIALPESVLEKLRRFSPLQRVLLTTAGTLQTALTALFLEEVRVVVVEQEVVDDYELYRTVNLTLDGGVVVCHARSQVTTTRDDVRRLVAARDMGLGRILEHLGIRPQFELLELGKAPDEFWRSYRLSGQDVSYRIREWFPRCQYRG